MHFVRIGGEVHQRAALEAEQRRARVAVLLVLTDCMSPALPSPGVLQFAGRDRKPVDRKQQVDRVVLARMAQHLARDRELVIRVERQYLVVEAVCGFEVGEPERLAVELEAMPQDVQRALEVELLDERADE